MVTCICTMNTITEEIKVFQPEGFNEKKALEDFWTYVSLFSSPWLVGFNSSSFDLPYLVHRSIVRGVPVPDFKQLDLRKTVNSFFISYEPRAKGGLAYWATVLGIKQETCSGAQTIELWNQGKFEEIKKHNIEDVKITYELFKRCKEVGLITAKGEKFPRYESKINENGNTN